MLTYGVNRFVFSSSAAVYGDPEEMPIREDAAMRPVNPYGESKAIVEKMLRWYEAGVRHALRGAALLQRRRRNGACGAKTTGRRRT